MPLLKIALHTHSTSSDGVLTPAGVAARYAELGFDALAFTDHDYLQRPDWRALLPASDNGLLILAGEELTVHERGYVHVNRIHGATETLHVFNHPAEYDLPFDDLLQVLAAVARKLPIDAVEVSSKGFYTPQWDDPRIPYPKVAADDSHTAQGCGRAWIEVDCARESDEIIRAIRAGKAAPRFA
jgi:predicted metal-dependent phosphoesterase TrpH